MGGQLVCEKVFEIIHHQGDANHNHNEVSPDTCQNRYDREDKKSQILERIWRKGNPCILLVGM